MSNSLKSKIHNYLLQGIPYEIVTIPEGEKVLVFNPKIKAWIQQDFNKELVQEILNALGDRLFKINLNSAGFPSAADKNLSNDSTNYDAVWVRDSIWIYYALKEQNKLDQAKKLILKLYDYFLSPMQITRLQKVIKNPVLANDCMQVPHIRFNGNSSEFEDVLINGVPEYWNHKQLDAYGLFIIGVLDAISNHLINENDLTKNHFLLIEQFITFFLKIEFWKIEDSGAWEELERKNTSSIALVTRSLQLINKTSFLNYDKKTVSMMIKKGLDTVKKQLALGGESPDYPRSDPRYRLADFAMISLLLPSPLEGLSESEMRRVLDIIEDLKRTSGYIRYQGDSYQAGNYWIQDENKPNKHLTDNASTLKEFLHRQNTSLKNTEAQWFFDSMLAIGRMKLFNLSNNYKDLLAYKIHIKRALGQITGSMQNSKLMSASGEMVEDFVTPESINTIIINNQSYYLPSPITPLNWAKATLFIALNDFLKITSK